MNSISLHPCIKRMVTSQDEQMWSCWCFNYIVSRTISYRTRQEHVNGFLNCLKSILKLDSDSRKQFNGPLFWVLFKHLFSSEMVTNCNLLQKRIASLYDMKKKWTQNEDSWKEKIIVPLANKKIRSNSWIVSKGKYTLTLVVIWNK